MIAAALALLALVAPQVASPAPPPAAGAGVTFEQLWRAREKALAAGDEPAAERSFREIRRLEMERNVRSLDRLGLALVEKGTGRLEAGDGEAAEAAFESAVRLATGLPDGHYGLSRARLKRGILGVAPSVDSMAAGIAAFLPTGRGSVNLSNLATVAALLLLFAVAWAVGVALLTRRGGLLLHDLEEWLGPAHGRSASLALALALLLAPVATFQGWGWLPLWWLAVLFAYCGRTEKGLVAVVLLSGIAVGPIVSSLELRLRTIQNPLYLAALDAVEDVPDAGGLARLERAARSDPEDGDLAYLLGAAYKRTGRYDEAAALYRERLAADPSDAIARNNLANIEFVRGAYDAALARYRAGTEGRSSREVAATSFYNLSLAHLRKFDYQAFNEAKSNADRLAGGVVAEYDRWKYDSGDYAVVDLGLSREQVWTKFAGAESGVAVRNVLAGGVTSPRAGVLLVSAANRFVGSLGVLVVVAWLIRRVRGPKAFTLHCGRCGTPFCRHCHLGQVSGGLCSQCYHIFVVRDGVSGPARNRKMGEVQRADARRGRVFRVLSVLSPGAGQIYGGRTLLGLLLLVAWYAVLAVVVGSRLVPFTEVSGRLTPPWLAIVAGVLLCAVWVVANRLRPDFEVHLPVRRPVGRRARVAPGAA